MTSLELRSSTATGPAPTRRLTTRSAFWLVAASLAALTAFSTAPSPLYGIYQRQEHLSPTTITVVYAVYAAGVVTSLLLVGHVSDWYGRRPVLVPALLVALAASLVFVSSTSLPALVAARVLSGLALGAAVATAAAYVTDLGVARDGGPSMRTQVVVTVANVGGLAVGPLLAGLLAAHVTGGARLVFVPFALLLALAVAAVVLAPEVAPRVDPRPHYRPQRLTAPTGERAPFAAALVGDFLVFTVFGVFAGLASAFLSGPVDRPSPAWAGLAVFIAFGSGTLTQVLTMHWPLRRLVASGIPVLVVGLALVVAAAWLTPASLTVFLAGAALTGIGSGAIFRTTLAVAIATSPAEERAGALATYFVVGYLGLSAPVVAAGLALPLVGFQVVLLAFGVAVVAGLLLAAPMLLRLTSTSRAPR